MSSRTPEGRVVGPDGPAWKGRNKPHRQDRQWVQAWSPEQIANRLHLDFPDDESMRISHEAIYQALFVQSRGALERELVACLRTGRALRVPRGRAPLVDDPRAHGAGGRAWDRRGEPPAAKARCHTAFATNFVDLARGRLIDVVAGRSAKVVDDWLAICDDEWLSAIDTVAIDPFSGYATGVGTSLGHARLVVDPFHAVALANRAIDDVRRRVQQDTLGHRGRSGDPFYGIPGCCCGQARR